VIAENIERIYKQNCQNLGVLTSTNFGLIDKVRSGEEIPLTESLKDTVARFLPYWHSSIAPDIKAGKRVLIAAHGNSLRALVKYLDHTSEQDIVELNIPTGIPLVYELDEQLQPVKKFYLGDQEAAMRKAAAVANQAQAR